MSGLAGYVLARPVLDGGLLGERMLMAMPGPGDDMRSMFSENGVTFLHSGSALIGTGKSGRPMSRRFSGKTMAAVLDGQIYNREVLRRKLQGKGYDFHTNSDAELALLAYREWNTNAPTIMEGVFALAVWDDDARTLFLTRDPMGVKPLYTARVREDFLFATDPSVLLKHGELSRTLTAEGVCALLRPMDGAPRGAEILRDVESCPPGHWIRVVQGRHEKGRYWNPPIAAPSQDASAALEMVRQKMEKAMDCRKDNAVLLTEFPSLGASCMLEKLWPEARRIPLLLWDNTPFQDVKEGAVITGEDAALGFTDAVLLGGRPDFSVEEAVSMLLWKQAARRHPVALSAVGGDVLLSGRRTSAERVPEMFLCEPYRCVNRELEASKTDSWERDGVVSPTQRAMGLLGSIPERAERLAVYAGLELRMPFADPALAMSLAALPPQSRESLCKPRTTPFFRPGEGWSRGIETRFSALLHNKNAPIWQLCRRETTVPNDMIQLPKARLLMVNLWLEHFRVDFPR